MHIQIHCFAYWFRLALFLRCYSIPWQVAHVLVILESNFVSSLENKLQSVSGIDDLIIVILYKPHQSSHIDSFRTYYAMIHLGVRDIKVFIVIA